MILSKPELVQNRNWINFAKSLTLNIKEIRIAVSPGTIKQELIPAPQSLYAPPI